MAVVVCVGFFVLGVRVENHFGKTPPPTPAAYSKAQDRNVILRMWWITPEGHEATASRIEKGTSCAYEKTRLAKWIHTMIERGNFQDAIMQCAPLRFT